VVEFALDGVVAEVPPDPGVPGGPDDGRRDVPGDRTQVGERRVERRPRWIAVDRPLRSASEAATNIESVTTEARDMSAPRPTPGKM